MDREVESVEKGEEQESAHVLGAQEMQQAGRLRRKEAERERVDFGEAG